MQSPDLCDVIVIGGGLSGLIAARDLYKKNIRVILLEARDRVGGRTFSKNITLDRPTKNGITNCTLDLGGMWMGPHHNRLMSLCHEFGVPYFPSYEKGKHVQVWNGVVSQYEEQVIMDVSTIIKKCNELAADIDTDLPWKSEKSLLYDSMTVQTFFDQQGWTGSSAEILKVGISTLWTAEVDEISLLYFLFYIKAAGSFEALIDIGGGAQQWTFEGGAQQISNKIAAELGNEVVRLNSPVQQIFYGTEGVKAVLSNGKQFNGKYCIVAVPPILCTRITFYPPLPPGRNQFHQRVPMGSVVKVHVIYEEAWWRKKGYSGTILSDEGPFYWAMDEGFPDDYVCKNNCLLPSIVGFVTGKHCQKWDKMTLNEKKNASLRQLYNCFQSSEAWNAIGYVEHDWRQEEYSLGCYVGFMPPGVLTQFGHIMRQPVGPLHWASTEIATTWCGYMEGALESGERASKEVSQICFRSKY